MKKNIEQSCDNFRKTICKISQYQIANIPDIFINGKRLHQSLKKIMI